MFEQWTKNVAWNESTHDGGLQNIKQWVTLWLSWEVMNTRGWRRHGFWVGCTFYDIQLFCGGLVNGSGYGLLFIFRNLCKNGLWLYNERNIINIFKLRKINIIS